MARLIGSTQRHVNWTLWISLIVALIILGAATTLLLSLVIRLFA